MGLTNKSLAEFCVYKYFATTLFMQYFIYLCFCKNVKAIINLKRSTELELRSVFLNCEFEDTNEIIPDSEFTRFHREEYFKHNTLRNCTKKLAITVKLCNEPDETFADEYIPIEHVLSTHNKRIRLLNPYILRLRRERPFQIYRIQKLDTVTGVLSSSNPQVLKKNVMDGNILHNPHSLSSDNETHMSKSNPFHHVTQDHRTKTDGKISEMVFGGLYFENSRYGKDLQQHKTIAPESKLSPVTEWSKSNENDRNQDNNERYKIKKFQRVDGNHNNIQTTVDNNLVHTQTKYSVDNISLSKCIPKIHKYYVIYEIGRPDLWYNAEVQLYEKVTTRDGKPMWNEITKETASVSTIDPLWKTQDFSIRYRTKDILKREDYNLPSGSLCLVLPLLYTKDNIFSDDGNINNNGEFIIVPIDDVIVVKSNKEHTGVKIEGSSTTQYKRQVVIRTTRTLLGGGMSDLEIIKHGSDRYLKLPHTSPHRAQLDLEVRADGNKLIIPGSSGRLTSIVSDTRESRSILNLQVTNTGLAPAHFRVIARECSPQITEIYENEATDDALSQKFLIPPMHTKVFILDIPLELSFDNCLCSLSLLNGDGDAVATRDVRIKKDDRCFCIWHCECVCLGDDPKLLCRNMSEAELTAAGLSMQGEIRRVRSACYPDLVTINMFVIFIGVLLILFFLGFIKAILGLIIPCIGSWGLELLLTVPRKIDHYYEKSLKCRSVIYDKDGWPVHPDTKKRTVLLISKPMEFILNVIMFITLPCILLWDALTQLTNKCQTVDEKVRSKFQCNSSKKCFSTHETQSMEPQWRRRKGGIRKWMTPQAEELSTDIWQYGLSPTGAKFCDYIQPLLNEIPGRGRINDSGGQRTHTDSEQDDTEYVLMQMQKSKESLTLKSS